MKRPQPDLHETLKEKFITNVRTINRLKRLWGTEFVNGVEVMKKRQYYHPVSDRIPEEDFEKLFKFLGAYEEITESETKGISKAWFYFNKNKASELPVELPVADFVADNLNKLWWNPEDGEMPENITLTSSVVIDTAISFSTSGHVANIISGVDQAQAARSLLDTLFSGINDNATLITIIEDNFDTLWQYFKITQEGVGIINKGVIVDTTTKTETPDEDDLTPNDPWLSTLIRYAMRSNGTAYTVKELSRGISFIASDKTVFNIDYNNLSSTYVLDIQIPYTEFTPTSPIVVAIANDLSEEIRTTDWYSSNKLITQQIIKAMDSKDLEDDPELISRPYVLWEEIANDPQKLNNAWYQDPFNPKDYYLKAAIFDNPRDFDLTYKELVDYVLPIIDSGYKKKKVPWWKKAIAIIIFVVAVVFSLASNGWSLKAASLATAVLFASTVITLLLLTSSILGSESWAAAFAYASKTMEPLVTVATIVLIVNSFTKEIEKAAGKQLADMTGNELLSTIIDVSYDALTGSVEGFIDSFKENFNALLAGELTNVKMSFVKTLTDLFMLPQTIKLKELQQKNKDLQTEYEKMQEEAAQENDILQGFANIYPSPATADWSYYASLYDLPYERGGGVLAIGNIQKTTVQALRKGNYDDPAFDSVIII